MGLKPKILDFETSDVNQNMLKNSYITQSNGGSFSTQLNTINLAKSSKY